MLEIPEQCPQPRERLLDHGAPLPFALHAQDPGITAIAEDREDLPDVRGIHAVTKGAMADSDSRLLAPDGVGQRLADILHMNVINLVLELPAERDGVLAGDEAVAGIEVEPRNGESANASIFVSSSGRVVK